VAKHDAVGMLSSVPLFSECTPKELDSIRRAAKEVTHAAGAVLAREGDTGLGFFLILEGTTSVTVGGQPRATMGPGDFFGEISLLDEGPRTATVTAETPVRLLAIAAWVFKGLIEEHPSIAAKMLRVVAQRLRAASADITH
jgi:CRP/FNR family cyclic AMP-dependent transcriptional regulator